jgi:hypothetical protein
MFSARFLSKVKGTGQHRLINVYCSNIPPNKTYQKVYMGIGGLIMEKSYFSSSESIAVVIFNEAAILLFTQRFCHKT